MAKYKKLSHREHVLTRSGMYISSVNTEKQTMYVAQSDDIKNLKIEKREIGYNAGFYKLFDEIISNASDSAIRTKKVKNIKVELDKEKIAIYNDGPGIPIELHDEEKIYNPELIFGHLLTGENYEENEEKMVAGQNGIGAKAVNIFSTKFIVDICDGKQKYKQIFKDNMAVIGKPVIKECGNDNTPYVKITYYPDFKRFGMKEIDNDTKHLIIKRCLDVAVYNRGVRVYFNKQLIKIKHVKDYMEMHLPEGASIFYEKLKNGWEIGLAKSPTEVFEQVSLVNGTTTFRGGTHVNWLSLNVSKELADAFSNRKTKATWVDVKNKLFMFLICEIGNPTYDSQVKENLTNYIGADLHQNVKLSQVNIKKILKSEIMESIMEEIELKELQDLKRKQKNLKNEKVEGLIPAKGNNKEEKILYIFEGLSALSGFRKYRDPKKHGAYPLRGKFRNVSELDAKSVIQNKEVAGITSALNLDLTAKVDFNEMQYDKVYICSDADIDGDHIACTLVNFFYRYWPSLFREGKVYRVLTPLLVAQKGKEIKKIYTDNEFKEWSKKEDISKWSIEYKKGLAALSDDEYKEILQNPKLLQVSEDDVSLESLDIWFGKDTAKRKEILLR